MINKFVFACSDISRAFLTIDQPRVEGKKEKVRDDK